MKDFKEKLQDILQNTFEKNANNFRLLRKKPTSNFEQYKKIKNEFKNNFDCAGISPEYVKTSQRKIHKIDINSINNLGNGGLIFLQKNTEKSKGFLSKEKIPLNKIISPNFNNQKFSQKYNFFIDNFNSSNEPKRIYDIKSTIFTKEPLNFTANQKSDNASQKIRSSLQEFLNKNKISNNKENNFFKEFNEKNNRDNICKNTINKFKSKNYLFFGKENLENNYCCSNQNSDPNFIDIKSSCGIKGFKQNEIQLDKDKKDQLLGILDENSTIKLMNSFEKSCRKNFSDPIYNKPIKTPIAAFKFIESYNTILNENPEIKNRLKISNENFNKIGYDKNKKALIVENFGLLTSDSDPYTKTNAGKEFCEFMHRNLNLNKINFNHYNRNIQSNSYDHMSKNKNTERNSLKNLYSVKSQLESLFEKKNKKDSDHNSAMDDLCAFLNYKHNKNDFDTRTHPTDRSVKLIEEIQGLRKSIKTNKAKSANKPKVIQMESNHFIRNNNRYLNTVFAFSPSNNHIIKANTSNFILTNKKHKSIFANSIYSDKQYSNFINNTHHNIQSRNTLETSINTSNYFTKKINNTDNFKDSSINNCSNLNYLSSYNYNNDSSKIVTEKNENNQFYQLTTCGEINNDNFYLSKFNTYNTCSSYENLSSKKNRLNPCISNMTRLDDSVEEFSKDFTYTKKKAFVN